MKKILIILLTLSLLLLVVGCTQGAGEAKRLSFAPQQEYASQIYSQQQQAYPSQMNAVPKALPSAPGNLLDQFNKADILLGHDQKSCTEECKTINKVCVSSVMSFRHMINKKTGYLVPPHNAPLPVSDEWNWVFEEAPQRCDAVYNMQSNLALPGARVNICTCV